MPAILFGEAIFARDHDKDHLGEPRSAGETVSEMARLAKENRNNDRLDAVKAVNGMKEAFGNGVSTRILFYNASGHRLTWLKDHGWSGNWGPYGPANLDIEVGQWLAAHHQKGGGGARGSQAAISYLVEGTDLVFTIAWDTPFSGTNRVVAFLRDRPTYDKTKGSTIKNFSEGKRSRDGQPVATHTSTHAVSRGFRIEYATNGEASPIIEVGLERA